MICDRMASALRRLCAPQLPSLKLAAGVERLEELFNCPTCSVAVDRSAIASSLSTCRFVRSNHSTAGRGDDRLRGYLVVAEAAIRGLELGVVERFGKLSLGRSERRSAQSAARQSSLASPRSTSAHSTATLGLLASRTGTPGEHHRVLVPAR